MTAAATPDGAARIEAALRRHPAVAQATVVAGADGETIAYVLPANLPSPATPAIPAPPASEPTPATPPNTARQAPPHDQVAAWARTFDRDIYAFDAAPPDPWFDTLGWVSSYDGLPLSTAEMRAWAADSLDQVAAARPRRVLEIGCGTGMLLFSLAPHRERYHGTDISAVCLGHLATLIDRRREAYGHVTLSRQPADDLTGIEDDAWDAVVISSVTQYFPGIDYLHRVLTGLLPKLRKHGTLFLFDVRNHRLLRHFYVSVLLARMPAATRLTSLRRVAAREIAAETELTVDPAYFATLPHRLPRLTHTRVRLQRTAHHNELSKYRYSVTLHLDGPAPQASPASPQPPRPAPAAAPVRSAPAAQPAAAAPDLRLAAGATLDDLRRLLVDRPLATVCLRRLRNARLDRDGILVGLLDGDDTLRTAGDLVATADRRPPSGLDPEDVRTLAESLGYRVDLAWSPDDDLAFDALFTPLALAAAPEPPPLMPIDTHRDHRPRGAFANVPRPLHLGDADAPPAAGQEDPSGVDSADLAALLREHLLRHLPADLLPACIILLDRLSLPAEP
jgi:ubiquinone/menaquinone biosynthesis C-methylase UbiE